MMASDLATGYWILRCNDQVVIRPGQTGAGFFPYGTASGFGLAYGPGSGVLHIGDWQGKPCYAADIPDVPEGVSGELSPLRPLYGLAGAEAFGLAGRAVQLLDWQKNHRYCGRCGQGTTKSASEFAMQCPSCRLTVYPRLSPAVMVLVCRGPQLLLARSPHFRPGVFSALAGFVEAGETLEACARREVREEVGVEIANLRYFESQPWPFPDSLMIAFFADYAGGELSLDPTEIEAADWFSFDALPLLPDPVSIARRLIDAAIRQRHPL